MKTWTRIFMDMCDTIAQKSKDTSTKVGCVIVGPDNEVRSMGFNGFPRGACDDVRKSYTVTDNGIKLDGLHDMFATFIRPKDIKKRYNRPLKYKWTEHAERNAIYNAARVGIPLKGCTIYINSLPPCTDCARAIIQSGITTAVIKDIEVPERWKKDCDIASEMFNECGVTVCLIPNV